MATLNLDDIQPVTRAAYIAVGRRYGSTDTLAQAAFTLAGYAKHQAALHEHGFGAEDGQHLQDAHGYLSAAIGAREGTRTQIKITSVTYVEAFSTAKGVRERARSVLAGTRNALKRSPEASAPEAIKAINATLDKTSSASDDAELLATQLDELGAMLADPTVNAASASRGGPAAAAALVAAAAGLRGATPPIGQGTPGETERMDLLDGLIIDLTRSARAAARAATNALGQPAIAVDLALSKLPKKTRAAKPVAPPPVVPPVG